METSSMHSQFTGREIAEYLNPAFPEFTPEEFLPKIIAASKCKGLHIAHENGKITGVLVGVVMPGRRYHICWIRTEGHKHLQKIIVAAFLALGYHVVTAIRDGKLRIYDTRKLLRRLYG